MTLRISILKTLAVAAFLFAAWPVAHAADKTPEVTDEKKPVDISAVDTKPEFPGGETAMYKWIAENLKFPPQCDVERVRVNTQFIIEEDGSLNNISADKPYLPALNTEVIRILSVMPKWKPATVKGRPVRVLYELPITFKLKR